MLQYNFRGPAEDRQFKIMYLILRSCNSWPAIDVFSNTVREREREQANKRTNEHTNHIRSAPRSAFRDSHGGAVGPRLCHPDVARSQ